MKMLSPLQIARTLNFDAILDLIEAAESTLCAHRAAFTPASPADGLETMTRALALLDRTASIRKTLAQIHATFTQPQTPTPSTPSPDTPPPSNEPRPEHSAAALDQFQKLLGENADVSRQLEQLIADLQKDSDAPIPTESVMAFIKSMDPASFDALNSMDPLDPFNPYNSHNSQNPTQLLQSIKSMRSMGSIGSIQSISPLDPLDPLDPLNPLAALGPLSPLPPLAPLRIPRNATSPFDFTNIAPVAPYTPPKPAQPQSPALKYPFTPHVPTIKAYAPRSCRVLPWEKLPHYAAETATRAEKLTTVPSPNPTPPGIPTPPDSDSPTPSTKSTQSTKSTTSTSSTPNSPHHSSFNIHNSPPPPDTS